MTNTLFNFRGILRSLPFLVFFSLLPASGFCSTQKNYFPLFECITDNVTFWEKVYEVYSVNTAVLHDRENLDIIYEIVPLVDRSLPGAAKINEAQRQRIKEKFTTILERLAAGKKPVNAEERRVLQLFRTPHAKEKLKNAAQNLRFQTGLKEQFLEGHIRSGAYIGEMKKIFASYGLPEELAYLPHVESSFNVQAHSRVGAAGVWQFTASTGKYYMTIDPIIDERRDPYLATHAAAKYLQKSIQHLGTWPLAITAYNYGLAGMIRALEQEGNYPNIFKNYRQGYFKFASRNFYAEFLAALNVARRLERLSHIHVARPEPNHRVTLPGFVSARDISRYFNVELTEMRRLNPALGKQIWQGDKYIPQGFQLRLPHNNSTVQLAANLPNTMFQAKQKRPQIYQVRAGDNAGKIARKHGISLAQLRSANNLNSKATVLVGQKLHIPSTSGGAMVAETASPNSNNANTVILKDVKKMPPT